MYQQLELFPTRNYQTRPGAFGRLQEPFAKMTQGFQNAKAGTARLAGAAKPALKAAGKVAGVAAVPLVAGFDFMESMNSGEDAVRAGVGAGGSAAGAAAGALLGSALGPLGTVAGGLAGGALGGWLSDRGDELVRGKYAGFNDIRKGVEMQKDYQNAVQSGNQYKAQNLQSQMDQLNQPSMPQLSNVPSYNYKDDPTYQMQQDMMRSASTNPYDTSNPLGIYQTASDERDRRRALFGDDLANRAANRALTRSYAADTYKTNQQMGRDSLNNSQTGYNQAMLAAIQAGSMRY
jgi:hypothetical protein